MIKLEAPSSIFLAASMVRGPHPSGRTIIFLSALAADFTPVKVAHSGSAFFLAFYWRQ